MAKVLPILQEHPGWTLNVINGHKDIPAIYLLSDFAKKLQQQGCIDILHLLFDKHLDEIIENYVFNVYNLNRLLAISSAHVEIIMEKTFSNEACVQKIRDNSEEPEEALHDVLEQYPQYRVQLQKLSIMPSF